MSSKISIVVAAVLSLSTVGCAGSWVSNDQYKRDIGQLKEYNEALERELAEKGPKAAAYDRLQGEMDLTQGASKFYADMAESLRKALAGLGVDPSDIAVGPEGQLIFKTDLLFDLGSWNISAKGKEVLGTFAKTQKGNVLKIVGHTDRKPIVRAATKQALDTDTNLELSVKRAIAVAGELIKNGLSERGLAVEGKGATQPRGADKDSRRVEIFVIEGASAEAR